MAEGLFAWLAEELRKRGLEPTEEDFRAIVRLLEEREWISLHPELYRELREETNKVISAEVERAAEEVERVREFARGRVEIVPVRADEKMHSLEAVGSDASRCPLSVVISRVELLAGIAVRCPSESPPSILREVVSATPTDMPGPIFRFYVSAKAESLIPLATIHQLTMHGRAEVVVIDGPLSISEWYKEVPRKAKKAWRAIQEFIRAKNALMRFCRKEGVPLIGVVKRSRTRYFHNYFGFADKSRYSDQYVFSQLLKYGQRTGAVSMKEAIRKWRGYAKGLLISKLSYDIYGFYIRTSRSPLTPPVRVEFPEYVRDMEDWVASYVLSTAVQTYEPEFDGLPKVQCLAHRDVKISKRIMREIYKEQLYALASSGRELGTLATMRSYVD